MIGEIEAKGYEFDTQICTKTLYNYIDRGDVFLNLTNKRSTSEKEGRKRDYKRIKDTT